MPMLTCVKVLMPMIACVKVVNADGGLCEGC